MRMAVRGGDRSGDGDGAACGHALVLCLVLRLLLFSLLLLLVVVVAMMVQLNKYYIYSMHLTWMRNPAAEHFLHRSMGSSSRVSRQRI